MALTCLASCSKVSDMVNMDKINIVTTIFPEYDWVRNVVGNNENVEITLLLDNGADLHSYQPTTDDVLKIATCDLFIYVGGESDEWVDDALKQATNKDMKVIDLMEVLGDEAYEEEIIEGMEAEEEEGEEEEEIEYDEHVWLSLKNAMVFVQKIADTLKEIDPDSAGVYESNAQAYKDKLMNIDERCRSELTIKSNKTMVFADRFPFRYFTEDYDINYYAAFVGCSAETEASFETILFLAEKVDENDLNVIFTVDNSDQKIAKTVIDNTASKDQTILVLDSMQNTDKAAIDAGATYLDIMAKNVQTITDALE